MKAWTKFHPSEEFPPALVINNSDRDPWDSRGSSTRRRDIPGYRVDLSRRERERKENGRKITKGPLPSLWSGGRSRPSFKVFESSPSRSPLIRPGLERPISLDAGLFALAAVPLARERRSRVLERGFWKGEPEDFKGSVLLSRSLQQPKNRGVLIERPFHGPVSGPSRPFDSNFPPPPPPPSLPAFVLAFVAPFCTLFLLFLSFFHAVIPPDDRDTLDLGGYRRVFSPPLETGNPRASPRAALSLGYNTLAS